MTRYWNVELGANVEDHTFTLTCRLPYTRMPRVGEGDFLCLTTWGAPTEVARVARCRIRQHETEVLLDRRMPMEEDWKTLWSNRQKGVLFSHDPIVAADPNLHSDPVFADDIPRKLEAAVAAPFSGQNDEKVRRYIRDMMVAAFEDEMMGPAEGPVECVFDTNVTERYLVGGLPPKQAHLHADIEEKFSPAMNVGDGGRRLETQSQADPVTVFNRPFLHGGRERSYFEGNGRMGALRQRHLGRVV